MKTSETRTVEHQYATATDKQVAYIERLAKQAGIRHGVSGARREYHGKNRIPPLKRQEASEIIDWLKEKVEA